MKLATMMAIIYTSREHAAWPNTSIYLSTQTKKESINDNGIHNLWPELTPISHQLQPAAVTSVIGVLFSVTLFNKPQPPPCRPKLHHPVVDTTPTVGNVKSCAHGGFNFISIEVASHSHTSGPQRTLGFETETALSPQACVASIFYARVCVWMDAKVLQYPTIKINRRFVSIFKVMDTFFTVIY